MKYAIIAAGEGSRLTAEGVCMPKPLVEVGGERLIDRLIRIFLAHEAEEVVVVCNDLTSLVSNHLEELCKNGLNGKTVNLRYMVKTTPSSMHSFMELAPWLQNSNFVLTTVDTIFSENAFGEYIERFKRLAAGDESDGLMGVTTYIDDEKPLYVSADERMKIQGFRDTEDRPHYISAGVYGLTPKSIKTLERCMARGESRMRNFQRALLADGLQLEAFDMGRVMDIDHASDIRKAEDYLSE